LGSKGHEWEKSLSRRIEAPVIVYGISDTCGSIGYTLIVDGEVVEDFFAEDRGSRPAPGEELVDLDTPASQFGGDREYIPLRWTGSSWNRTPATRAAILDISEVVG
jgi:hypothetical protein